jgi:hypothetical protein
MPDGPKGKIFINYRRDDSADAAGRLYDRLEQEFGKYSLFMDVETMRAGGGFRGHLGAASGGARFARRGNR